MQYITSWVTNIILFILLATVIDMLLPNSSMQKYAKMVIGLLLIAIILSPILKLFSTDFEHIVATALHSGEKQQNIENAIEVKKKEIQASQHAYILEQMAVQLKADVKEELMNKYQMKVDSIIVQAEKDQPQSPKDINSIKVILAPAGDGAEETIAPVRIDTSKPLQEHNADVESIKQLLAAKWSIKEEILAIELEGG
ncbi:stage III sporulation protein AF [Peribacillus sp. SCS-37]|uniref:stage III sporulation protein AF n=1 Tax=Paraperibacillus esterisolvens TaxID=3115296 RepID=UPI00390614C5